MGTNSWPEDSLTWSCSQAEASSKEEYLSNRAFYTVGAKKKKNVPWSKRGSLLMGPISPSEADLSNGPNCLLSDTRERTRDSHHMLTT